MKMTTQPLRPAEGRVLCGLLLAVVMFIRRLPLDHRGEVAVGMRGRARVARRRGRRRWEQGVRCRSLAALFHRAINLKARQPSVRIHPQIVPLHCRTTTGPHPYLLADTRHSRTS